jgi:flagellar M-ring protein FliF
MREKLEQLILRVGGRRRAAILGLGVGAVLLIVGVSWWATAPEWVPAASGVPLESVSEMTEKLDDARVSYRLEGDGKDIFVTSGDLARARVALAQGGFPAAGRPGMELFDQPSWGMTDFTQRLNYRRALEGELERTISKMVRGIESVRVHLAVDESPSFRRQERDSEASVVLMLKGGQRPGDDLVQGIQHLVASSVGGLDSEKVMVLDDAGRLLSAPNEPGSLASLTHRQLAMQREVERHLEEKANDLIAQVVGGQNARVRVTAEINFDRVERTRESVDPDGQVTSSEQTSEIIPGAQGGAGSRTASTTYDNSRSLETFASSVGGVKRLTVAVLVNDREVTPGTFEPRAPAELQQIQTLVEGAVGFSAARGDQVSVVGMRFTNPLGEAAPAMNTWEMLHDFHKPILTLIGLLLAFVLALRVIRTLRPEPQPAVTPALPEAAELDALPSGVAEPEEEAALAPVKPIPALPNWRERTEESIGERPEVAVRLVKSWLQEGNG